jgi:hypothetical protein
MPRRYDHSVNITNSTTTSAVTGGSHNRVEVHAASPAADPTATQRLMDALDELHRLIEAHAESLPQPRLAARDVERLKDEVRAEEPDKEAARDTVGRLLDRVSSIGSLANAIYHVKELIGALWPA